MAKGFGSTKSGTSSSLKRPVNNIITRNGMFGTYKVLQGFNVDMSSNAKNVLDNFIYTGQKLTNGSSNEGVHFYSSVSDKQIRGYASDYRQIDKIYKDMAAETKANPSRSASIESKYEQKLLDYISKRKKQLNS